MTELEKRRRNSLLCTLAVYGLQTVHACRREMEGTHGIPMSADLVRADFTWLDEMGLVRYVASQDAAQCTERGLDVAFRRASFPGLS